VAKACGERISIAANQQFGTTRFVCVRGGNVMGTNGSVVPLFCEQLANNNELTLTDPRMTRFFITLDNAIQLLFKAVEHSIGGEVFVLKMPAIRIKDLAELMIAELGNSSTKIKNIGIRPGEKIHEILVSRYEASRIVEEKDYFIILPFIHLPKIEEKYKNRLGSSQKEYSSENTIILKKEEIKKLLDTEGWLDKTRHTNDTLVKTSDVDGWR
jgi:FlaA1/EpsC-like NDP-sugar epimerase